MDQRELYNIRDLPQGKGAGFGSLGGGAQVPPSCSWWIRPDGNSYPRTRSSFPRIMRSSSSVFLAPTRSSLTSALTVASSKPSSWTYSLQIHCNVSAGPRSHTSMGPIRKSQPYSILSKKFSRVTHGSTTSCKIKHKSILNSQQKRRNNPSKNKGQIYWCGKNTDLFALIFYINGNWTPNLLFHY